MVNMIWNSKLYGINIDLLNLMATNSQINGTQIKKKKFKAGAMCWSETFYQPNRGTTSQRVKKL